MKIKGVITGDIIQVHPNKAGKQTTGFRYHS